MTVYGERKDRRKSLKGREIEKKRNMKRFWL